jgi:hypothetical protein
MTEQELVDKFLGREIKCKVSKIQGVATQIITRRFSTPSVVVSTLVNGEPKEISTEVGYVEVIGLPADRVVEPTPTTPPAFEFGEKVKDRITGFAGEVNCISRFASGCRHVAVVPNKMTKEGAPLGLEWFSEGTLESVAKPKKEKEHRTGGAGPIARSNLSR